MTATIMSGLPANDGAAIVPSDTVGQGPFRSIYVGVSGDVALVSLGGTVLTFKAVPVGILPVGCTRVNATNTTATNIVGLQ
jgi:hypothetical protein